MKRRIELDEEVFQQLERLGRVMNETPSSIGNSIIKDWLSPEYENGDDGAEGFEEELPEEWEDED